MFFSVQIYRYEYLFKELLAPELPFILTMFTRPPGKRRYRQTRAGHAFVLSSRQGLFKEAFASRTCPFFHPSTISSSSSIGPRNFWRPSTRLKNFSCKLLICRYVYRGTAFFRQSRNFALQIRSFASNHLLELETFLVSELFLRVFDAELRRVPSSETPSMR